MHAAPADFAFGGETFAVAFGDFCGFLEGLRDFPGIALGISRPIVNAGGGINANDAVFANANIAKLLCDAAGFVDPMTGDGLRFALRGGELAAEAALRELATGAAACVSLQAARAKEFGSKWRLNRGLRALASSPRSVAFAASLSKQWQAPVRTLVRLAGDVSLVQHAAS